jgi:hypothetical protein
MAPQPTRELLAHFDWLHVHYMGERAVIRGGKDAKLLASLSASHGPARVMELMDLFFEVGRDDDFIASAGFSVGVFVSQCAKLIARQRLGHVAPKGQPSKVARSFDAVDAAFDAIERQYADQGQPGPTTRRLEAVDCRDWEGPARPSGLRRVR